MANILLAEDDASLRDFITRALQKAGHTVKPCADGGTALEALENGIHFDLLLTDIVMPVIDGLELSTRAARVSPLTKTMFITGFAAMTAGQPAAHRPGVRVISKPFHLSNLIEEVEKLLSA